MFTKRPRLPLRASPCPSNWLTCLLLAFALITAVRGQGVTILHSFDTTGENPACSLVQLSGGTFYGTTSKGGTSGGGTAFSTSAMGAFATLHAFGAAGLANDGLNPSSGLIYASDGNFYGTSAAGGSAGKGALFKMTSAGVVTILHSFGAAGVTKDGTAPKGSLVQGSDGNLYGTTSQGGTASAGTVFEMTLPQDTYSTVHNFGDGTVSHDGASPTVGLTRDSLGNLYGTTPTGGTANLGTVYKINAQKQLSILYNFALPASYSFTSGASAGILNGSGGYSPNSRLTLGSDGNLYGTTGASGYGYGAVFQITPTGQETVLHYFDDGSVPDDGEEGTAGENGLVQGPDGNFYGTTSGGGAGGQGTFFEMTSTGAVTILHSFSDGTVVDDGATPLAGVVQGVDGYFYGTTSAGGAAGLGTIFKVVSGLPEITSALAVSGGVGIDFAYQTGATQSPSAYSVGTLPAGLAFNSTTGLISGTPVTTGTSKVTLTATNAAGSTSVTLVISILPPPVITSLLSGFGSTSTSFAYQIAASGSPDAYGATGLPTGVAVNPETGVISGTPTETGTFSVTLSAGNVAGSDSGTLTLVVTAAVPSLSQEYVQLHSFQGGSVANEGSYPGALVAGPDSTLYGVTAQGGAAFAGTIFNASGAGGAGVVAGLGDSGGSTLQGLIYASDGNYYGTTQAGGSAGLGTIFKMTPAGAVTLLHTFGGAASDGANPQAGVIQGADGNFYGTTQYGGSKDLGTLFKMTPQGVVSIIHSFGDGSVTHDGTQPVAGLVQDSGSGVIYGTTLTGGVSVVSNPGYIGTVNVGKQTVDSGTVFSFNPATGAVVTLHSFADGTVTNDGQRPHAALVESGGVFYGTTYIGGSAGQGTVFKMTTAGTVTILHHFGDGSVTNDGMNPLAPVVAVSTSTGLTLYGTTQSGGVGGEGSVFALSSADDLTLLHSFDDGTVTNDGQTPMTGLCIDASGNLYGTTTSGGAGSGTLFAIAANLTPPVTIAPAAQWTLTGTLPAGLTFDSSTGAILGTPSASDAVGAYSVAITSPSHVTTSQTYTLTQTFSQWALAQSTSNVAAATPMKDGVPNLLKYLCDISPAGPMNAADRAALPAVEIDSSTVPGTDYLALIYRQAAAASSANVVLQTSNDLQTWTTVDTSVLLSRKASTLSNGDSMMELGVPLNSSSTQFIRMNVGAPSD